MTRYVEQSSNRLRATFGEPIEFDDEDEEFVFGSSNVSPAKPSIDEKSAEAARARALLTTLGFGPGALVARRHARAQVKNPWTWGVVIFVTGALHQEQIRPLGIVWLSDGPNRGVTHMSQEDVFLVSSPPPPNVLNSLLGVV